MSTKSPARVPGPFARPAYTLGHQVWMPGACVLEWDEPFAERSTIITTLVAGLNRMDAAVLALGSELDSRAREDLRAEIRALKERTRRGEVPEAVSEDWTVLGSEVDRALQGRPFQQWYDLGAALGRYHFGALARDCGAPLPDFEVVLDKVQRVCEEAGLEVPVLGALVQHAPRLAATGPRGLLREVLGDEKQDVHIGAAPAGTDAVNGREVVVVASYDVYPKGMDRAVVSYLLDDLHTKLYRQLADLTRPDPALGANGHGDDKPVWDGDLVLTWRGAIIRQFRAPAKNQKDLIEAFHRANWERSIPGPFRDSRRLDKTVTDLNKRLRPATIRFRRDGTGEGVNWEPTI